MRGTRDAEVVNNMVLFDRHIVGVEAWAPLYPMIKSVPSDCQLSAGRLTVHGMLVMGHLSLQVAHLGHWRVIGLLKNSGLFPF